MCTINDSCTIFPPSYTADSCSTLAPSYLEENYANLNLGPDPDPEDTENKNEEDEESNIVFETPKKLTTRNTPFKIVIDFDQYRRKREYKGKTRT